jgi:hypothetical protein
VTPTPTVKLSEAAAILGLSVRAAESALRRAGIASGYPRADVETLHRPGQGARTDLKETTVANVSYTETYTGYIPDLALPYTLDKRLQAILDGDDREVAAAVEREITEKVTAMIRKHGVNTDTGEWYGDWSAEDIVRAALDRAAHPA